MIIDMKERAQPEASGRVQAGLGHERRARRGNKREREVRTS